jgi:FkbM family methyltransferase
MKIYYGIINNSIDVTDICFSKLLNNNIITIPTGDQERASYFTDPLDRVLKKIIISNNNNLTEYDYFYTIQINVLNNKITAIDNNNIYNKIKYIHSKLNIKYGSFDEELPEQKMAITYLTGKEKVLEIGGNIGRNSLVIASILENNNNLVTLESSVSIANQLIENRDLNGFKFNIEDSALSNRKLIQIGWDTIPSETLLPGYTWVKTISFDDLQTKYNIVFDTLVLDCEGAFYYILMDIPHILDNINLIIMENDYCDISNKKYIDVVLTKNNFYVDYTEAGGWGPCHFNFFEVWKKTTL